MENSTLFGRSEDVTWRGGIGLVLLLLLIGAAIKLGGMALVLSYDLKKSECAAAYWKARTTGQPSNYCPPGCECDARAIR